MFGLCGSSAKDRQLLAIKTYSNPIRVIKVIWFESHLLFVIGTICEAVPFRTNN